jgi:hypothetical protein
LWGKIDSVLPGDRQRRPSAALSEFGYHEGSRVDQGWIQIDFLRKMDFLEKSIQKDL